jgi:hypothetical protein
MSGIQTRLGANVVPDWWALIWLGFDLWTARIEDVRGEITK